jgi:F-box and leucine-rich repeat protein GRR1
MSSVFWSISAITKVQITEFTEHQRSVFCVFSGSGVTDLRHHLNQLGAHGVDPSVDDADNDYLPQMNGDADDDQTMTGMMGATVLNGDEDADADEELDDGDGSRDARALFGDGAGAT